MVFAKCKLPCINELNNDEETIYNLNNEQKVEPNLNLHGLK